MTKRHIIILLTSLLALLYATAAAGETTEIGNPANIRHHVILTVDMAGCGEWNGAYDVRREIRKAMLDTVFAGVGRPLYQDGDLFSMTGFAIDSYSADLDMYALPRNLSKPLTYMNLDKKELRKFIINKYPEAITGNGRSDMFSLVSVAKPYNLRALPNDTVTVNRTFIVMVTDHRYNGNDFYEEIESLRQKHADHGNGTHLNYDTVTSRCYDVEQNYFMRPMKTFPVKVKNLYSPDGYVEVYEAVPFQGNFTLAAAIDYPERITAKRLKHGGYAIDLPMSMRQNGKYTPERIEVSLGADRAVLGKAFSDTTLTFSIKDKGQTEIDIKAWLRLHDGFYNATVMSPDAAAPTEAGRDGLNRTVQIDFERPAKILFFDMPTWMWSILPGVDDQDTAAGIYTAIALALIVALVAWFLLRPMYFHPDITDFTVRKL